MKHLGIDMKTVIEFAELKGTTRQTIYNAIERGELDSVKKFSTTLIRNTQKNRDWQPSKLKIQLDY